MRIIDFSPLRSFYERHAEYSKIDAEKSSLRKGANTEGSIFAKAAFVESDIMSWSTADYKRLLAEVEPTFQSKPGDLSYNRLMVLVEQIEAYEQENYQIDEWAARPSTPEELAEYEATKRGEGVLAGA